MESDGGRQAFLYIYSGSSIFLLAALLTAFMVAMAFIILAWLILSATGLLTYYGFWVSFLFQYPFLFIILQAY